MSRSRTRLAADWFAKLRLQGDRLTTQDDIDTENTISTLEAEKDALAAQLAAEATARAQALADAEAARVAAVAQAEANAAAALAAEKAALEQALADAEAARVASEQSLTSSISTTVAELVSAAPATLDTLNELAAAIGDDPNFAATMTSSLAGKSDVGHGHSIANVSGLQTAIDGKANSSHSHSIANVTGLQSALDGKQAAGNYQPAGSYQAAASELTWIDQAGGNYGTVKVDDDRGTGWAGYSIQNNWVFMADGTNTGLYNDMDNEWVLLADRNGRTSLYYNGGLKFETTSDGAKTNGNFLATGNVTAYSDARVKENLEVIPNALDKVSSLTGYTYDRTDMETTRQTGLIAQDVLAVLPEAVMGSEEDRYSVAYGNMIGLLVEAIKELKAEVDTLKGA